MAEAILLKKIDVKIGMLELTKNELPKLYEQNKQKEFRKTVLIIDEKVEEIQDLKRSVQESMLESGKPANEVSGWGQQLEEKLDIYDQIKEDLEAVVEKFKIADKEKAKLEEVESEKNKLKKRIEEELIIEEAKIKRREELEKNVVQLAKTEEKEIKVKLPKLEITKFKGTHLDWLRFWNQFENEIDKSHLSPVAKYSYLKEFVEPKVRSIIDGLPFTSEGYNRAKSILSAKYGKPTEVANAHIQGIISLPTINNSNIYRIHEFYEKLLTNVNALETMGKLKEINGYVRFTLDKLSGIRSDLVRTSDNWQSWSFHDLVESLKKWTERNPMDQESRKENYRRDRVMQTSQKHFDRQHCIYCGDLKHKATECQKVTDISERKKIVASKRLCFNCIKEGHRANECKSKGLCQHCKGRHHTSICSKLTTRNEDDKGSLPKLGLFATQENAVVYPVVVVKIDGIVCRALLDTGAGSSYISSELARRLEKRPVRVDHKQIETMLRTVTTKIEVYDVQLSNSRDSFSFNVEVSKVDKPVLISLPNPHYDDIIKQYPHLKEVQMEDADTKDYLPVHVILGAAEYVKIKTRRSVCIGKPGEPVAEYTYFGWTIMAGGNEKGSSHMMFTRSSEADYINLCSLDVLGIKEESNNKEEEVYHEFKDQLGRSAEGWYETNIIWKDNKDELRSNKIGSMARLKNMLRRLRKDPVLYQQYDQIIRDQLMEGIVERVRKDEPKGREFYLPHRPVIKETAKTTKVRIVYDASARENDKSPSLNDVTEVGPSLQKNLWKVLVRNRMCPIVLTGDMKQAFLQIRIREEDRDALRFHWVKSMDSDEIETLRFTRAIFGLGQSPFLLNGTVQEHLNTSKKVYPDKTVCIQEIEESLYVDDLVTGGTTIDEVMNLKETAIRIFGDAKFELHKWQSNNKALEDQNETVHNDTSHAKQELGTAPTECKILGVSWNKQSDTFRVNLNLPRQRETKRGMLKFLASIFDPLGLISPVMLHGKDLYRVACDAKLSWDQTLPEALEKQWRKWLESLPQHYEVPRSIISYESKIRTIELHAFADASLKGVSAVIYAVIDQRERKSQGLLVSKSRLSKKGLSIPRLELVAAHIAANLMENVRNALHNYQISKCYGWSDSLIVLFWLKQKQGYKQFVSNRVQKINQKAYIEWRHVPTQENPADIGSRGCKGTDLKESWTSGPSWLQDQDQWPYNIATEASEGTETERKRMTEIFKTAINLDNDIAHQLLSKFNLKKTLRILSWINRFNLNCHISQKSKRKQGPLTTEEIKLQLNKMIKKYQHHFEQDQSFEEIEEILNLKKSSQDLYECHGRITGDYPIFIPNATLLAEKMVENSHYQTIHGGVGLTMTKVRSNYWIPRLRQITKNVIKRCHGCKRFRATPYVPPIPGQLPSDRTKGHRAFQVIGLDYAGPIVYKRKNRSSKSAYILLITCSLSRAVHLELVESQKLEEFTKCFKRFVARRGRPQKIYSDNAKTFQAASNWLKSIMKSEKFQDYLAENNITWQFNLSRAPWWGGQFERMVGLMKQCLYKSTGKANLSWNELEEVLFDIESNLNNRPLSYLEDDIQFPVLTPNTLAFGEEKHVLEEDIDFMEGDLRKRAKYIKKCKENLWNRWKNEYLKSLRERHNMKVKRGNHPPLAVGDVVIIKGDERNRRFWRIGIIDKLIEGKDGIVRVVKLRCGKTNLERAVQHLYPLELHCDYNKVDHEVRVEESSIRHHTRRPTRTAAAIAKLKISDQAESETNILQTE